MLLKRLSEAFGVSGAEDEVRDILKKELEPFGFIKTDSMGNLFVQKSYSPERPNIMLCAHMDEVGLMIKSIDNNGLLKFFTVGGMDERILVSKRVVVGPKRIKGVIGAKAIHLQEPKEREIPLKTKNLYIDIGAKNKEETSKLINIGDYAAFDTCFREISDSVLIGKAFDDRLGCYVITEILKRRYSVPLTAAFTVQEEIGMRGSAVAAYSINPDLCITVEGTFASDVPDTKEEDYCSSLGHGPAITFMDMTYIAQQKLIDRVISIAERRKIPFQLKRTAFGGTDGGRIHTTREGIPTIVISIPCRYIHSPVSMAKKEDIQNTIRLVDAIITIIQERG